MGLISVRRLAVFIILNQHRGRELLTNLPAPIFFVIKVAGERQDSYLQFARENLASLVSRQNIYQKKVSARLKGRNLQYPFAFVINIKLLCEQYVHEVVILISEVLKGHSPKDSKA